MGLGVDNVLIAEGLPSDSLLIFQASTCDSIMCQAFWGLGPVGPVRPPYYFYAHIRICIHTYL